MKQVTVLVVLCAATACHSSTGPAPAAALGVTPPGLTILTGDTATLVAQAVTADGGSTATPPLTWQSADTTRVTVTTTGLVRGVRPGETLVKVLGGALEADVPVAILSPVDSINLTPDTVTKHVGDQATLGLFLYDSTGAEATGRLVHWVATDTNVVRLDTLSGGPGSPGVSYVALAAGTTLVIATCEGKKDTSKVTVIP